MQSEADLGSLQSFRLVTVTNGLSSRQILSQKQKFILDRPGVLD